MKLASFDIFDTTLLRICGKPQNIFFLVSRKLFPDDLKLQRDFFNWRLKAEYFAVMQKGSGVTIDDIYNYFPATEFSNCSKDKARQEEQDCEYLNLIANPQMKAQIEKYRQSGYRIIFISDMYLPSSFLWKALKKNGCIEEGEKVFVSCEESVQKSNGLLFEKIKRNYDIDEWVHYGDNHESDYIMPRKYGINSCLVNTSYTKIEKRFLKKISTSPDKFLLSTLVGFQRAARLVLNNDKATFAADYIAPTFLSYVVHVVAESRKKGIETLYFLSRDSYLFYKIAQCLYPKESEIQFKYLFVSRKSLTLPCLYDFTLDELRENFGCQSLVKKGDIGHFLNILKIPLEKYIQETGSHYSGTIRTSEEEQRFWNYLSGKNMHLKEEADKERILLEKYLEQENFFSCKKAAIVDLGWNGTTRLLLNRIRNRHNHKQIYTFYWLAFKTAISKVYGDYDSYTSDQRKAKLSLLLEKYYTLSPYKSTLGYCLSKSGKSIPSFDKCNTIFDNDVLVNNLKVCLLISKWTRLFLNKLEAYEKDLEKWDTSFTNNLITFHTNVCFSVFENLKDNEFKSEDYLIKRLHKRDIFRFLSQKRITLWDEGSVAYSFGPYAFTALYRMRAVVSKIKTLYKMIKSCLK